MVDPPARALLLASDAVVEGIHVTHDTSRFEVGWKAVTANVSDIAAMGGRPLHLLVTVAAPAQAGLDQLFDGIGAAAEHYGCEVVGGDLSMTTGPLVVGVAITGTVDEGEPVTRGGARPGDAIYLTGPVGHAAASGYAERPRARVEEGVVARRAGATAMIDVSDGLLSDLGHIADESHVGFALDTVPVAEGASLDEALRGGEDYELIVVGAEIGLRIGMCTADPAQRTLHGEPVGRGGWEHRWD